MGPGCPAMSEVANCMRERFAEYLDAVWALSHHKVQSVKKIDSRAVARRALECNNLVYEPKQSTKLNNSMPEFFFISKFNFRN